MSRFDPDRARAFGSYAITALIRDATEDGRVFIRLSRADLAMALDTKKLYSDHIEQVRSCAANEGVAMADLGYEFIFFSVADKLEAVEPDAEYVANMTSEFRRLLGSVAADELWDSQGYRVLTEGKQEPARGSRKNAPPSSQTIRLRG